MPRELTRQRKEPTEVQASGLDEFKPSRERVTKEVSVDSVIGKGWSTDRKVPVKKSGGNRPDRFEALVPEGGDGVVVHFVEDAPFVSYWVHWVPTGQAGKRRPFVCLIDDCPLCDVGNVPKPVDCLNVIALIPDKDDHVEPKLYLWSLSADPAKAVRARAENKRTSPINKEGLYFEVSKTLQDNGFNSYSLDPVKSDDLQADFGIDPLTTEQFTTLTAGAYSENDIIQKSTKRELQEVAAKLED